MRQKDAFVIITRKISSEAEAGTEAEYVNANDAIDDGFTNNIEFIFEGDKINNPSPLKNNITFDEYNNTIEFTFEGDKIKNPSSPPPKNKNGTCTTRITHSPSADIVAVDDAGRCSYKNPFDVSIEVSDTTTNTTIELNDTDGSTEEGEEEEEDHDIVPDPDHPDHYYIEKSDHEECSSSISCFSARTDLSQQHLMKGIVPSTCKRQSSSSSTQQQQQRQSSSSSVTLSSRWSQFIINTFHKPFIIGMQGIAGVSARNPIRTIILVVTISIILFVSGLATNFTIVSGEETLWTPFNSDPVKYKQWLTTKSQFRPDPTSSSSPAPAPTTTTSDTAEQPPSQQYLFILFHSNGNNVLGTKQLRMIFNVSDTIMMMSGYNDVCTNNGDIYVTLPNGTRIRTCSVSGVQRFWNFSSLWYDWTVGLNNTEEAIKEISAMTYPGGEPVDEQIIYGYPIRDNQTGLLSSILSYLVVYVLPRTDQGTQLKYDAIKEVINTNKVWQSNFETPGFYVEVFSETSYSAEFTRGLVENTFLVPIVVLIMSILCCFYFYRGYSKSSRVLLGLGALLSIILSMMQGYGLMFLCGIPFTSLSQSILFIVMGVGLDDAFIIIDTYERTSSNNPGVYNSNSKTKTPEERIFQTIQECGLSIFLTTLTSTVAFAIGCTSPVPAVYWLCLYAFPNVAAVLLCQLTFFVSCIVLDERRIQRGYADCCFCLTTRSIQKYTTCNNGANDSTAPGNKQYDSNRWMTWYAEHLLRPKVQVFVVISFFSFTGLSAWSVSLWEQKFTIADALPKDSYVSSFIKANDAYRPSSITADVYFRNEDFSSKYVRSQMQNYLSDLNEMKSVSSHQPVMSSWPDDFERFLQKSRDIVGNMTFDEQLEAFMNDPQYCSLHCGNLAFGNDEKLVEYRTSINFANVRMDNVKTQINAYLEQNEVTRAQPLNQGRDEPSFFTYGGLYWHWAFISTCINQLIQSTVIGIISVTAIVFVLIPHWTAALFICPITCMMYIDILGILQWAGVYINAVSVVTVVMSIGLIVDYIMHVLLRFYETPGSDKRERIIKTLSTMGASVLAGGLSTFLGTVPLMFGTNTIFYTVFMSFLSLVTVALVHGLVFLPVILIWFGPEAENSILKDENSEQALRPKKMHLLEGPQEFNDHEGRFTL